MRGLRTPALPEGINIEIPQQQGICTALNQSFGTSLQTGDTQAEFAAGVFPTLEQVPLKACALPTVSITLVFSAGVSCRSAPERICYVRLPGVGTLLSFDCRISLPSVCTGFTASNPHKLSPVCAAVP